MTYYPTDSLIFQPPRCIFELAAFRAANPAGKIRLMPHYSAALGFLGIFAVAILAMGLWSAQALKVRIEFGWAQLLFMLATALVPSHLGRRACLQKQSLIEQLESFTLDGAGCRLDSDRRFIYEAVKQWYGGLDEFIGFVRGPLRQQLLQCCSQIPIDLLLVLVLPLIAYKAEILLAMWKGGVPGNMLIAFFCSSLLGLSGLWTAFLSSVGLYMVDRLAKPWSGVSAVIDRSHLCICYDFVWLASGG